MKKIPAPKAKAASDTPVESWNACLAKPIFALSM